MPLRHFLPENLQLNSKDDILPWLEKLLGRELNTAEEFEQFLTDVSETESAISEDVAWRYIKMTCNTQDTTAEEAYLNFVQNIQLHLAPMEDSINKKITESPFCKNLEAAPEYFIYFRGLKGAISIFREENTPIIAELQTLAQQYSAIQGAMTIEHDGKTYTMQQAGNFLLKTDRQLRQEVWEKMQARRAEDVNALEDMFDQMVSKRHQMALNAGYENFREYMFASLGRYDYTVQDCFDFHRAVEQEVVPLLRKSMQQRKDTLGYSELRPWDTALDPQGREPLAPFKDSGELLQKTLQCFSHIDKYFQDCLSSMHDKNLLDLESRIGKAPGGYNYPLAESNVPFIFMNASGNLRDVETLIHEAGHAVHSFLMAPLKLNAFKNTPSEVAELASMSMELLSMDGWDAFFPETAELKRAKLEQLEGIISTLPWIATVDAFQHWMYENPEHTRENRKAKWLELNQRFGSGVVDYTGYDDALAYSWHKQLHIFEVPFYYIEYGFAQLGAIGVWRNFNKNQSEALEKYKKALQLGYTHTIPEIYETAGLSFSFSPSYVKELFDFVGSEMQLLA